MDKRTSVTRERKPSFDVNRVRKDFPILHEKSHGKPLVYLDNAATSQKPQSVINIQKEYYEETNANVHRGIYELSEKSTEEFEAVRNKVACFIGAGDPNEVIFTRGTTDAINLVANSWGESNIGESDVVVVSRMEHHSNFVPWQALSRFKKAEFVIVEITSDFRIDLNSYKEALARKPKLVALTHMSNVLGVINPISELADLAHDAGAVVVVDGAQSVPHIPVDLRKLPSVDFYSFSAHKACGPTGVGVLWGRRSLLESMRPYQYGGAMILHVDDGDTKWNEIPWKFEAGTPNIAGVIGMGSAIDYLDTLGMDAIENYELEVAQVALEGLLTVPGLNLLGPESMEERGALFTFTLDKVHPHDLATFLDSQGIAVRAGHHCAQPLLNSCKISATTRASFSFYNTAEEARALVQGLKDARKYFKV